MRKVFLHGELGNSLGKEWDLEVDSVQEALWAIEANTNGLTQFLMKNNEKFTHYTFAIDDKDLEEHQLKSPIGDNTRAIHIMPQVAGGVEWLIYIVVMIVVSLVMQAIFKPPKPKDAIETNSYLFAGTQNVAAQGVPVPIGYGRLRVGSVVISAAIRHLGYSKKGVERLDALPQFPILGPFTFS
jgi:predicted phage tail protein